MKRTRIEQCVRDRRKKENSVPYIMHALLFRDYIHTYLILIPLNIVSILELIKCTCFIFMSIYVFENIPIVSTVWIFILYKKQTLIFLSTFCQK